jgi:hypothetical protein
MVSAALLGVTAMLVSSAGGVEVRDGERYPVGTNVTGPCGSSRELPARGAPGQVVHQWRTETHISADEPSRKLGLGEDHDWAVAPDLGCRPLNAEKPGRYSASIYREEDDWRWNEDAQEWEEISSVSEIDLPGDWYRPFRVVDELRANAGGPYATVRGKTVRLNGSRSRAARRHKIVSYSWRFRLKGSGDSSTCGMDVPGRDAPAPSLPSVHKAKRKSEHPTTKIGVLCSLVVTLTVKDDKGDEDSDTAVVNVTPRTWPTKITHVETVAGSAQSFPPPGAPGQRDIRLGVNVPRCGQARGGSGELCPPQQNGTWQGSGYRVRRFNDDDGPFDNVWWVVDSDLAIRRAAVLNPWILENASPSPGAAESFYQHNLPLGAATMLEALRAHEGDGRPGVARSGHTSARREAVASGGLITDPRQQVEQAVAPDRDGLTDDADGRLKTVSRYICRAAQDPLPELFIGTLEIFDQNTAAWTAQPFGITQFRERDKC